MSNGTDGHDESARPERAIDNEDRAVARGASGAELRKAQVSLVEWDRPAGAEEGRVFGTLSVAMQYDPADGSVWARVQVGDTWAYVRPAALEELAFKAWRMASDFRECRWDLHEGACTSLSCRFEPGPKHIGRLLGAER